jgi:hypothetical protein
MVKVGFGLFLLCKFQSWHLCILLTSQLTKREIYSTSTTLLRIYCISKPVNKQMVVIQVCNGGSLQPRTEKKKKTSSVYDCTVEDVEYICNSNSTLCFFYFAIFVVLLLS